MYALLAKWNKTSNPFAKTQAAYVTIAVLLIFIAGISSLINPAFGQAVAFYALIAILTFVGNGVIWAIIRTFVVPHIEANTQRSGRKK